MNEFGITLIWLSLQITVLCVVAAAVYSIARRGNPKAGAAATLSTLLLVSALSAAAFAPVPSWMDRATNIHATAETVGMPTSAADTTAGVASESRTTESISWLSSESATAFLQDFERRIQRPVELPAESWHWTAWLAVLFCAGLAVGSIRLVLGLVSVSRLRRSAKRVHKADVQGLLEVIRAEFSLTRQVTLCESSEVSSAATIGWQRPLILLPSDWREWSDQELRSVLAHEVAHIAHRDFPCWLAAQIGLLLHFYHPLVHWLANRLRLEQELAADADAARHSGGAETYLRNLAELAVRQVDQPVAWPARTFLPSRGTLVRRVEMLRDRKSNGTSKGWRRAATVSAILMAAVMLSGLRQPAEEAVAQDSPRTLREAKDKAQRAKAREVALLQRAKQTQKASTSFDLRYVPATSTIVAAVRPNRIAQQKDLKQLVDLIENTILTQVGVRIADLDQAMVVGFQHDPNGPPTGGQPVGIMHFREGSTKAVEAFLEKNSGPGKLTEKTHNGMSYLTDDRESSVIYRPNPLTVISGRSEQVKWLMDATKTGTGSHTWGEHFKSVADSDFALVFDLQKMRPDIVRQTERAPNPMVAAFSPLWKETDTVVAGGSFTDQMSFTMTGVCRSSEGAEQVENTAKSLVPLAQNSLTGLKQQLSKVPPAQQEMMTTIIAMADKALKATSFKRDSTKVTMSVSTEGGSIPIIAGFLLPAIQSAREAARRTQGMNNLKQIGLAFHNYHAVHEKFPGSYVLGPDGKTKHSWRVAILPFLEEKELYEQYNLDEPWDSENNKKVLAQMPAVFRDPSSNVGAPYSSYYGLSGETTGLGDADGVRIRDFLDGTSNTILIIEAKRKIEWTKPEDIPFDPEKKIPKFGGSHPGGYTALLCDGSVRFISENIDKTILKALITRAGREVIGQF